MTVKDNGAGIPPDKLDSIFDMFMQVDRTVGAIAGRAGYRTNVGKAFDRDARRIDRSAKCRRRTRQRVHCASAGSQSTGRRRHDWTDAESESQPQRRVLIVDDNRDSADSLAMLMEITGNKTYMAHDGVEAVEAIEKHRPEVVLLDIGLPGLDGHEVCRRVREQPWGKDIIVIALTGWGQEDDRRKSEEAGFNGHLVKPVDYDKLLELLSSLTNGRRSWIKLRRRNVPDVIE